MPFPTFTANDLPGVYIPALNDLSTGAAATDAEVVAARGAAPSLAANLASIQLITEATTARTLTDADAGKLIRWTAGTAKTLTINTGLTVGRVFAVYNAGAASLTLAAGAGMTITPPSGGTLVVPVGGLAVLWIVATGAAELAGVTTAAV